MKETCASSRKSTKKTVKCISQLRQNKENIEKKFHEEGWAYLRACETLYQLEHDKVSPDYPLHHIRRSDTKYDIFRKMLPPELLMGVLQRRCEDREQGLSFDKGCGNIFTIKMNIFVPLSILAVRTIIQGRQEKDIEMSYAGKKAVSDLKQRNPKVYCANIMIRLLGMYWFQFDSIDEFQISENMGKVFRTFGDAVAGDEKLAVKYSGSSGFVRQVITKPSRLGLWMYQAAVKLKSGTPCLIYTKMHNSCQETQKVVRYHDIIKDWANMILERTQGKQTVLFMDSYYLTEESRVWLREKHVNYIASIHKGRFGVLVKSLSIKLHKSGTFVCAYNKSTKESCVHCWSSHERLGKNSFWAMVLVDTKGGRKTMSFLCLIITMLDSMHVIGLIEFCMANHGLIGFMVIIRFVQITSSHVY